MEPSVFIHLSERFLICRRIRETVFQNYFDVNEFLCSVYLQVCVCVCVVLKGSYDPDCKHTGERKRKRR